MDIYKKGVKGKMARTNALKKHQINVRKFNELKKHIGKMELKTGEQIAHCIDSKSENGKYYYPEYVISNKGRIWTLNQSKWLTPTITKGYWTQDPSDKSEIYIHRFVCHYFQNESDKVAIEFFGEENLKAHHIRAINIPKRLKGTGNRKEKIAQCMKDSCKDNIVYQEENDHQNDTRLANGNITIQESNGTEVWSQELQDIRTLFYNSGQVEGNSFGTYYIYSKDEKGNLIKNNNLKLTMKGFLDINNVYIGDYKFNADENKQYIIDHQDEILKEIENKKPTKKDFLRKIVMDNISIYYSLK